MHLLDDSADVIRVLNIILCLIPLCVMLTPRAVRYWRLLPVVQRMHLASLTGMLAATAVGSVQAIVADAPGGPHVLIYTAALILATVAAIIHLSNRRTVP